VVFLCHLGGVVVFFGVVVNTPRKLHSVGPKKRDYPTWAQANAFGPKTFGGLIGSFNAWRNIGSFATSSTIGSASSFSSLNPF
jgi:hypothetical protein